MDTRLTKQTIERWGIPDLQGDRYKGRISDPLFLC